MISIMKFLKFILHLCQLIAYFSDLWGLFNFLFFYYIFVLPLALAQYNSSLKFFGLRYLHYFLIRFVLILFIDVLTLLQKKLYISEFIDLLSLPFQNFSWDIVLYVLNV